MPISIEEKITLINQTTLDNLASADEVAIIKEFTDSGIKILEAGFGFAWLKPRDKESFTLAYKSTGVPYQPELPRQNGTNQQVLYTENPHFVTEIKEPDDPRYDVRQYMKSYVILPITYKNRAYGNIVLCFKDKKEFSQIERSLSVALGNATAQAITINRLMQKEQEALMAAEGQRLRFRAMIENSYDVMAVLDSKGAITDISGSATRMSGYEVANLIGQNLGQFIHPDDLKVIQSQIQQTIQQPNVAVTVEARYLHSDGSWRWLEANGFNKLNDPNIEGIIANIRDITQRREAESTIKHQALHDALTGLPNREEFSLRFEQVLEQAKRNNGQFAVMFLDMDRFKNVNDRLGHSTGDALLKVVASRLAGSLRGEDVAARFGGDEFLVLVNEIRSGKDIVAVGDKILKAVNLPANIAGQTIYPSVSIGIAIYPNDGLDLAGLKKNADIALYRAKENGRNRFSLYDHSLNGLYQAERFNLENQLREALLLNQITVHYQPIVSLKKNKLLAVEALARWNHPERGLLLPREFIALAEETGLIAELDKAVLKQACAQAKLWQDLGLPKFRVAVNLSAQQFSEPEFVSGIANSLAESNLDASCLELEITESLAMGNLELTSWNLRALKKFGVHITIDDFGTGYSSLSYLKRFPIHGLKIDKNFIRHCITNPSDTSITKTIVSMAQNLNLKVVAEGVEGQQQLDFLKSLRCDGAQGFFIAKPMPAQDFPKWFFSKFQERTERPSILTLKPETEPAVAQL